MKPTATRFDRVFNDCPGALYGSSPEFLERDYGFITVDHKMLVEAIQYLARKRVKVTETAVHGPAEIHLTIEWRA